MTFSDVEEVRRTPGRSILLFITDRCPVGCAHCSVDSRRDSPTITDYEFFEAILDWLCAETEIGVVGISGGEPFVERRGLTLASRMLAQTGKQQVVYTSGVWATAATPPAWINDVLNRCSCVFLSTDAFHAESVPNERFVHAAQAIADAGAWIIVQVVGLERMVEQAQQLLHDAFGDSVADFAELNLTVPLTHGRGANVFTQTAQVPGHAFGPCPAIASPVVRYDGLVTGCCNESVVMDRGPSRLRRRTGSKEELAAARDRFRRDPLLRAVGGVGLGALTTHPRFADLASERFATNCHLCWTMLNRSPSDAEPDLLINVINSLVEGQQ